MKYFLRLLLFIAFLSLQSNCWAKKLIKLNPDTSDHFCLSFKTNSYNILVGYNSFLSNIAPDVKGAIKKYIDSVKLIKDTVDINVYDKLWDTKGLWFFLNLESEKVIRHLLDSGNAIIINRNTFTKTSVLAIERDGSKKKKKIAFVYKDIQTGSQVFEYKTYWQVCGGANF